MHADFNRPKNVISFSELRYFHDFEEGMKKIAENNEIELLGLSQTDKLDNLLKASNYVPVLFAIWTEQDKSRTVSWLKENTKLHAPLMFEQGLAEFEAAPTVETVLKISIPLMQAAEFRAKQDSKCSMDASVYNGDAHLRLRDCYKNSLYVAVSKHLEKDLGEILEENKEDFEALVKSKLVETLELSKTQELPNPDWLKYHGMGIFTGNDIMKPQEKWKEIRDEFANETIEWTLKDVKEETKN